MPDDIAWHLRITGVVQGVGFRFWTQREAERRNLRGWVRNRHDGSVEALVIGPVRVVEDMVEACRRGPRSAEVDAVDVTPTADDGSAGFEQRVTA
jgi:acylphosphatase